MSIVLTQGLADTFDLIPLDIDQEHVCAPLLEVEREFGDQIVLERADAEHEEAAEADREQDHAGLVARPPQAEHGMAQREPGAMRSGITGRTSAHAAT